MFGLGTPELIVILVIAFFIFGGKKLPELGAGLGKALRAFQTSLSDIEDVGKPILTDNVSGPKEINNVKTNVQETFKFDSSKT